MSLSQLIAGAAREAQGNLAQLGGALPGAKNFLYNGATGFGVYGASQVQEIMRPGGGSSRRVLVPLTVTRDQGFIFRAETPLVRTDLGITYQIVEINSHDSLLWGLALLKVGP